MTALGIKKDMDAHLWERDPDDWYVEGKHGNKRLFEVEDFSVGGSRAKTVILDPSCGMGRIVRAARAAGYDAYGNDIKNRGWDNDPQLRDRCWERDIFSDDQSPLRVPRGKRIDWIVTNAPFKHCGMRYPSDPPPPYIIRALSIAKVGACILLPLPWIVALARVEWLRTAGFARLLVITPRPSMPPGAVIMAGVNPGRGEKDFAWFIFKHGHTGPWTGGWCDSHDRSPVIDAEQDELINACAALEG